MEIVQSHHKTIAVEKETFIKMINGEQRLTLPIIMRVGYEMGIGIIIAKPGVDKQKLLRFWKNLDDVEVEFKGLILPFDPIASWRGYQYLRYVYDYYDEKTLFKCLEKGLKLSYQPENQEIKDILESFNQYC